MSGLEMEMVEVESWRRQLADYLSADVSSFQIIDDCVAVVNAFTHQFICAATVRKHARKHAHTRTHSACPLVIELSLAP